MIDAAYRHLRPLIFRLEAERAHDLSMRVAQAGWLPQAKPLHDRRMQVKMAGLSFDHPLGLAAGYDKGARAADNLLAMGFSHVEIGTVTPRPQPGNNRPRLFRLAEDRAVINRMGFNSAGHERVAGRLRKRRGKTGVLGVNLGANKTSADFAADYVAGISAFAGLADYFTINISSPNTPGLRALQGASPLASLLQRATQKRDECAPQIPLFLKVAPDLDAQEIDDIASALADSTVDALIVSNTTLDRAGLRSPHAPEQGGLSGAPLFERSTAVLARFYLALGPTFPLIGVGGVSDTASALAKIEAGASLVQLYSALVYEGPGLPEKIVAGLRRHCDDQGLGSLMEIRGSKAQSWASR